MRRILIFSIFVLLSIVFWLRLPNFLFHHTIRSIAIPEKVVALSFDDGPNPPYTQELLKVLDHHKVRATFFMIGRNIEMHRNSALAVAKRGHEVANHTYLHHSLRWASPNEIKTEILNTDSLIRSLGYDKDVLFRSPFGETGVFLPRVLWRMRRVNVLYDTTAPDYLRLSPDRLTQQLIENIHPGSIIVLHDGEGIRTETLLATHRLIEWLKTHDYRVVPVGELLKAN